MTTRPPVRLLGTFHKTGTVLWESTLLQAAARGAFRLWHLNQKPEPEGWDIAFDFHSAGLLPLLTANATHTRAVFCVRDPRDIIVSGAYYHMTSTEEWLHRPREHFQGMTYQQKISALPDMQARFQFEMRRRARHTIDGILQIPLSANNVTLTKLETLVEDVELKEFARLFDFLAFDQQQTDVLLDIARRNSLFSRQAQTTAHIRNGKPAQYLSEFSDETLAMYNRFYPGVAERLGYAA